MPSKSVRLNILSNARQAKSDLDDVSKKADQLGGKVTTVRISADSTSFDKDTDLVERKVTRLNGQTVSIKFRADDAEADVKMDEFERRVHALDGKQVRVGLKTNGSEFSKGTAILAGFDNMIKLTNEDTNRFVRAFAAVQVASGVAEPYIAGLTVAVGSLGSSLVAAGMGFIGYGAALAGPIQQIKALETAQQAAASGSQAAAAQFAALEKQTPKQVLTLYKSLEAADKEVEHFGDSLANVTFKPINAGLTMLTPLLRDLRPFAVATAKALDIVVGQLNKGLNSAGFAHWLSGELPLVIPSIVKLSDIVGHLTGGLIGMFSAFNGSSESMLTKLDTMTAKFQHWGDTLSQHSGFQKLMDIFHNDTPIATHDLSLLAQIVMRLVGNLAGLNTFANSRVLFELAAPFLQLANWLLKVNPQLVDVGIYLFAASRGLRQVTGAAMGIKGMAGDFTGLWVALKSNTNAFGQLRAGMTNSEAAASDATGIWGTLGGKIGDAWVAMKAWTIWSKIGQGLQWLGAPFVLMWGKLSGAIKAAGVQMGIFDAEADANVISLIVIGIAAVIAALVLLALHFKQVYQWIKTHWTLVAILLPIVLGPLGLVIDVVATLARAVGGFGNLWRDVWHGVADAFLLSARVVMEGVKALGDQFFHAIDSILQFGSHLPFVGKYFKAALVGMQGAQKSFDGALNTGISTVNRWQREITGSGKKASDDTAESVQSIKGSYGQYMKVLTQTGQVSSSTANKIISNFAAEKRASDEQTSDVLKNSGIVSKQFMNQKNASTAAKNALDGYTDSINKNGLYTQKTQDARTTLINDLEHAGLNSRTATRDVNNYTAAVSQNGASSNAAHNARAQLVKDILDTSTNAGKGRADLKAYTDAILNNGSTADQKAAARRQLITDLEHTGLSAKTSTGLVNSLNRSIQAMKSKQVIVGMTGEGFWSIAQAKTPTMAGAKAKQAILQQAGIGGQKAGTLVPGGYGGGDIVPAMLEPGETVVPKHLTSAVAPLMKANNVPGFASGGHVGGPFGAFEPKAQSSNIDTYNNMVVQMANATTSAMGNAISAARSAAMDFSGSAIVKFAEKYVHKVPYVWGGQTPNGWDCEGFVKYVYNHFGYNPPDGSTNQQHWAKKVGGPVPGGLAFFTGSDSPGPGEAGHVGIVVNGQTYVSAYDTAEGTVNNPIYGSSGKVLGFGIPPGGLVNIKGAGNMMQDGRDIYSYLLSNLFGGNRIAAAGATASMWGESTWNPESAGTGGWGLMGWTGNYPDKRTGKPVADMRMELPLILKYVHQFGGMGTVAEMKRAGSVAAAANLWGRGIERYGINDVHAEGIALATEIMGGSGATSLAKATSRHGNRALFRGGILTEPVVGQGVNSGAPYTFGELGREAVIPLNGSTGNGTGGDTYNIYVAGDTDPDSAAMRIHEKLREYKRRKRIPSLGL